MRGEPLDFGCEGWRLIFGGFVLTGGSLGFYC